MSDRLVKTLYFSLADLLKLMFNKKFINIAFLNGLLNKLLGCAAPLHCVPLRDAT